MSNNHKIVNGVVVYLTEKEEYELIKQWTEEANKAPEYAREERDAILMTVVDPVVSNLLRWNDMSEAKKTEWAEYRQALLDIENIEGYPHEIVWPTKPE